MAESSLRDRLRDTAKAFDGLLSLIPAKDYYGEDTTDQWKKKKQTKEEAAAARRAKLDPDSKLNRNAKEVMDERARNKRKLRELEEQTNEDEDEDDAVVDDSYEVIDGVEAEKPGEGLKKRTHESNKKQKVSKDESEAAQPTEEQPKLSKKQAKLQAKREKKAEKKADMKSRKQSDAAQTSNSNTDGRSEETRSAESGNDVEAPLTQLTSRKTQAEAKADDAMATSGSESEPHSPTFDDELVSAPNEASVEQASTTTSVSSTIPPSEKPKHIKIPADTTALRARLAAKIEALRAARKADGPDGKPIRTRQELIEARRAKQAQRKEKKQELRKLARLEEARIREEALASNSPGVMSPAVELDEAAAGNFSFGRVAFGDGSQMSHDLSYMLTRDKKKGPSDAKTALIKVQNQKKRLQELDAEKRADVTDKEAWLTARRRVEGEKIRDNEAILKKTIKRKETAKKKSEKAWKDRTSGVQLAQKERQKKREENIKKRREDKLLGKAGKKKKGGATKKKGGRPGFEGSFGVGGRKK